MSDDFFDLIIWYEPSGEIYGFQLCYNKKDMECALTWNPSHGFAHSVLDTGEQSPLGNNTPVLKSEASRKLPFGVVFREFQIRTVPLESSIREFVTDRLIEYASILESKHAGTVATSLTATHE